MFFGKTDNTEPLKLTMQHWEIVIVRKYVLSSSLGSLAERNKSISKWLGKIVSDDHNTIVSVIVLPSLPLLYFYGIGH